MIHLRLPAPGHCWWPGPQCAHPSLFPKKAMMYTSPSVLVAARPTLLRHGLVTLLRQRWPRLLFTLTAAVGQIAELVARRSFHAVVLDDALPGRALPELLKALHRARPTQRMVRLLQATRPKDQAATPLPWPGTHLLLPTHVPPLVLLQALAPWLDPEAAGTKAGRPNVLPSGGTFSARELEILHLVASDCCNQEIANRLRLSVRTVESHRRALLHKAGAHTSVGLAVQAMREGWIS